MGYKVKKIRVGTQQVRPMFPFYYDFRGKTWSQCQNDGWIDPNGATPLINSNGLYYNSRAARPKFIFGNVGNVFTNANKITITVTFNISNTSKYGLGVYIQNMPDNSNNHGFFVNQNNFEFQPNGSTVSYTSSLGSGVKTVTIIFDLANKTYSYSGAVSYNGTLSTTDVSNIRKANTNNFIVADGGVYLQTTSITVS